VHTIYGNTRLLYTFDCCKPNLIESYNASLLCELYQFIVVLTCFGMSYSNLLLCDSLCFCPPPGVAHGAAILPEGNELMTSYQPFCHCFHANSSQALLIL
jgi:hypothetical protein